MSVAADAPGKTVGDICRETGEPWHRVAYAILSRNIPHAYRVGRARLYNDEQVERIKEAMAATRRGPY